MDKIAPNKKLFYTALILFVLFIVSETVLRLAYFQYKARSPLALITVYRTTQTFIKAKKAEAKLQYIKDIPDNVYEALWTKDGEKLLAEFTGRYEEEFKLLVAEAAAFKIKMIVLYIPIGNYRDPNYRAHRFNRDFYQRLCRKYNVDYFDATDAFLQYPETWTTMLPENGHLSRFGNKVVVEILSKYIRKYDTYVSEVNFSERPKFFGDLLPNNNTIWDYSPDKPYRMISNSQGLRMTYDLTFPKTKQRILILGDSFTFGPYLHNHDTYSELLNKKYPDKEFINAGKSGYTITDESSLFIERAKYVEPDITILQVLF